MAEEEPEVCRSFRNGGRCRYGDACKFTHTAGEPIQAPSRPRGPCYNWDEKQECQFGDRCRFTHGEEDTRYSGDITQEICRNFQRGKCVFGDNCLRQHVAREENDEDPEAKSTAICYEFRESQECSRGDECRFSHDPDAPDDAGRRRRRRRVRRPRGRRRTSAGEEDQDDEETGPDGMAVAKKKKPRKKKKKKSSECFNWRESGECEYAERCRYKHGPDDDRFPDDDGKDDDEEEEDGDDEPRRARRRRRKPREIVKLDEECRNYAAGRCRLGENCRRNHVGEVEQQPQEKIDEICNNFRDGYCRHGEYCRRHHVQETVA